jgi:hypothetical protein
MQNEGLTAMRVDIGVRGKSSWRKCVEVGEPCIRAIGTRGFRRRPRTDLHRFDARAKWTALPM